MQDCAPEGVHQIFPVLQDENHDFAGLEALARVGAGVTGCAHDQVVIGNRKIILPGVLENEGCFLGICLVIMADDVCESRHGKKLLAGLDQFGQLLERVESVGVQLGVVDADAKGVFDE